MDPITAIANGVSAIFGEVGTWFYTDQEVSADAISQSAIDAQILMSNNAVAMAAMDENFTEGEQDQLLLYAIVAVVLIIVIAIVIMLLRK